MSEITTDVNWVATAVGTFLSFMLGGLWYSPKLFGKGWTEGARVPATEGGHDRSALIAQLVGTFLLAWVIAVMAAQDALVTTILIALTIACLFEAGGMFNRKSAYARHVESGFVLVMTVIMIACHALL